MHNSRSDPCSLASCSWSLVLLQDSRPFLVDGLAGNEESEDDYNTPMVPNTLVLVSVALSMGTWEQTIATCTLY